MRNHDIRSKLLSLALLTGCVSTPDRTPGVPPSGEIQASQTASGGAEEAAVAAALKAAATVKGDYHIGPTDLIDISVYQQPDLTRQLRVGQKGTISFPLIGEVEIGGKTVPEAQTLLVEKFKEFIKNPQVTVFIREYANKKVFVLGEVKNPGSVQLPTENRMTAMEAVAIAGGFTPIAAPDRTRVIRNQNGQNETIPVAVSDIMKRGDKNKDIPLEPNDVVYVPQSFF